MRSRRAVLVFLAFLGVPILTAQNPTGAIQQAHGGSERVLHAHSFQVLGKLTRNGKFSGN